MPWENNVNQSSKSSKRKDPSNTTGNSNKLKSIRKWAILFGT